MDRLVGCDVTNHKYLFLVHIKKIFEPT